MKNKINVWEKVFSLLRLATGNVDVKDKGDLQTQIDDLDEQINRCHTATGIVDIKNKGNLQTQVDNLVTNVEKCFTNASDGKKLIANAVTGKGVPTLETDTFAKMAGNITKIKTDPILQSKSKVLDTELTSVIFEPDSGYDGLSQVTASITLQEKEATLSTTAQNIVPDSEKVLSKVMVPAVGGTAAAGDVLSGKTFSSSAGISVTGTMANKGAWTGETTGSGNVTIPAGYHNGKGYVSGKGAYDAGASAGTTGAKVGTAAAGDVLTGKTFTNATSVGVTGTMANKGAWTGKTTGDGNVTIPAGYHNGEGYVSGKGAYDAGVKATKVGTAAAGDVLTGKTFTNATSVGVTGTMANKGGETVETSNVTTDNNYTYFGIPEEGYYNTESKIKAKNSVSGTFEKLTKNTLENDYSVIIMMAASGGEIGESSTNDNFPKPRISDNIEVKELLKYNNVWASNVNHHAARASVYVAWNVPAGAKISNNSGYTMYGLR